MRTKKLKYNCRRDINILIIFNPNSIMPETKEINNLNVNNILEIYTDLYVNIHRRCSITKERNFEHVRVQNKIFLAIVKKFK